MTRSHQVRAHEVAAAQTLEERALTRERKGLASSTGCVDQKGCASPKPILILNGTVSP